MDFEILKTSVTDSEQHAFIKICILQELDATFIHQRLKKALDKRALSLRSVQSWVKQLREGRTSVEHQPGAGRPFESRDEALKAKVKDMLLESKAWSVRELAARAQAPKTTVHRLLTADFGMIKRMAKWVPHTLTES